MKRLLILTMAAVLSLSLLAGCSKKSSSSSSSKKSSTSVDTPTQKPAPTSQQETNSDTPSVVTRDEFPTEGDDSIFVEPNGKWSVKIPDEWYDYGSVIENYSDNSVRFVYKKAYNDYGAGHVFTICTVDASSAEDVSTYPRAEELYRDSDIQIFVYYPTDVQFGGMDGSTVDEDGKEYRVLSDMADGIIGSLEVLG